MQLSVNVRAFCQELRLINKIVPTKVTLPILTHVLLVANQTGLVASDEPPLRFYATDLEVGLSSECDAEVTVPGKVALPAEKLLGMVEQFTAETLRIVQENNQILITCGAFKSRLQAMDAKDFPVETPREGQECVLSAPVFRTALSKVRYAITDKVNQHVLDGAYVVLKPEGGALVATDGKRLSLATFPYAGAEMSAIVPSKTLDILGQDDASEMTFSQGPRHLFFVSGKRRLTSRVIEAKFPAYNRIIPRDNALQVTAVRANLAAALRRVLAVAEESQAVWMAVEPGMLSLTAQSAAIGDADEQLPVTYDGPPVKVCINGRFVLDFLGASGGTEITIAFKDAKSAILLTDGQDFLNVVLAISA